MPKLGPFALVILLGAPPALGGPKPPDACALLTAADVEKHVGKGFTLSRLRGTASDNSNCGYLKGSTHVVNLMVVGAADGTDMATALGQLRERYAASGLPVKSVDGAGAGAFYVLRKAKGVVHFGKGPWHGTLSVTLNGKSDHAAEQALAAIAFGRLP
jgi:hypothetical protein